MRVVLVGSEPDRARLRARMNGSLTVVGEFESLGAARSAALAADLVETEVEGLVTVGLQPLERGRQILQPGVPIGGEHLLDQLPDHRVQRRRGRRGRR